MLGASHIVDAARSKLNLASGSGPRDNGSLHRWVLLKNSLLHTIHTAVSPASSSHCQPEPTSSSPAAPAPSTEESPSDAADAFLFPDPSSSKNAAREAQWFDAVLLDLEDDEDEDDTCLACVVDADQPLPALPDSDEDEADADDVFYGPMTSADDLLARPVYPYAPPLLAYPPRPYPPRDDVFELPVPDAVPDDSDDESDSPSTPSILRSSASSGIAPAVGIADDGDDDTGFAFEDAYFFTERDTRAPEC